MNHESKILNLHPFQGFVWERFKLLRDSAGTWQEVYDLLLDPMETANLAALRPVLADYLRAHALAWQAGEAAPFQGGPAGPVLELDRSTQETLNALGYM